MSQFTEKAFMQKYPLSKKKILKKTLFNILVFITPYAIVYGLFTMGFHDKVIISNNSMSSAQFFSIAVSIGIILLVLSIGLAFLYQLYYYRTYFYNFTNELIVIRKGVIAAKEITIPYYRVQDVYVDQDILDKALGLYDVHIETATAQSGARAHIDGVTKKTAEQLRELILNKMKTR